jgi:endonuclease I
VLLGEYVSIIQHPNGEPKQLALRENQLIDLLPDFLHYRTDTAPGSSGSPIFNDQWEIVGLHHSGVPKRDADGNILSRDGKIWTQDMGEHQIDWAANEGIRISRIAKHIRQQPLASDQQALRDTIFAAAADELLPAPPAPVQQNSATPQNGNMPVTSATGAVTWTIPLQISINLGAPSMNAAASPAPAASPVAAPARQPLSQPAEDSAELRDDLAEARRARTRPYYDAAVDQRDRTAYYSGLNDTVSPSQLFKSLSELVQRTHTTQLRYQPRSHVYPWVDLHPNGKLRSIYSGQDVEPEAFIREDVRIDQQRERLRASSQELVRLETTLAQAQNLELINLLEASLPYNCEHVVPQSWFDKREPMRGDLHHLFACESGCNSFRGNVAYFDFQDFGEAVRSKCGKALKESNQFEPENGKGAVARATLYFLLRYPGAINQNDQEYRVERLTTLLQWHVQFPVTDYERHRNMAIFQKQGNRNPLIDFPQLAERIDFKKGLGR